jgi:NAD(P)H-flavin reductase
VALRDETATARTIALRVPDWPGHVAGQRVDLRVTAADGYSAVREYSIASAPRADGYIELSIERLPDGELSPYLTQELAVGDRLEVRGPIGGWFVWHKDQAEPSQLVAGGSGHTTCGLRTEYSSRNNSAPRVATVDRIIAISGASSRPFIPPSRRSTSRHACSTLCRPTPVP